MNSLAVFNQFPKYSISIYDDLEFKYPRQIQNDCYVLSNVISDNYFPFNPNTQEKKDYLDGLSNTSRYFYVKIAVNVFVEQDTVGANSTVFYLAKNQLSFESVPVYYNIECLSKTIHGTEYRAVISLTDTEQGEMVNGKISLNLTGDYTVSLSFPLSISIANSATTSITQTSSVGIGTISSSTNNSQYFEISLTEFDSFEYSSDFSFNFSSINIPQSSSLFSTATTLYSTGNVGGMLRFFVNSGDVLNGSYFGVTVSSDNVNFNPLTYADFEFLLCFDDGVIVSLDPKFIFENSVDSFWNIVFKIDDISYEGNINYFIFVIKNVVEEPCHVSFLGFLNKIENNTISTLSTLSIKSLAFSGDFCYSISGEKKYLSSIDQQQRIKNDKLYCSLEGVVNIENTPIYKISTSGFSVFVPENAFVKNDKDYVVVYDVNPGDYIQTVDGLQKITSMRAFAPMRCVLLDTDEDGGYFFNGILIKNPIYLSGHKYDIFKKSPKILSKTHNILVNEAKRNLIQSEKNCFVLEDIYLLANKSHLLIFPTEAIKTSMFFSLSSEIIIQHTQKTRSNEDEFIVDFDLTENKKIILKSNETILIKKIAVIYAS